MKIIDWYIIKKFIVTFFFCIFLFTVIAVVVDITEKTDNFLKSGWSTYKIFTDYYLAFIPHIIALLFPLFVFIAVIFFTSKMANRSEIIAILASGTSFNRILLPYFITSIFLSVGLFFASSYYVPKAEVKRTYFEDAYVNANSGYMQITRQNPSMYYRVDSFSYAGIRSYDTASKRGGPVYLYKIKDGKLVYNMRATNIVWDTAGAAKQKMGGKWKFENAFERKVDSLKETITIDSKKEFNFNFTPADLKNDMFAKDKMTSPELRRHIAIEQQRGGENINTYLIELYRRVATPFSVIILTLIGCIIAARKIRGGSGMHIAIGFILAAAYILMDRFSTIFSTKGNLPPMIAAWIPNIIFVFVAIYLYKKAPK
ncbi:LptF/LptG family permease [Haoranjiania flava]|uniref:LptF/LptG family permease n=1 Tax=Haoranjiania flava TaxID=1856322 RepID=A0AAE3INB8_9BACT|nr:LptF/LptG family permease [Haoranjiania flava]MCU7693466.1 LptF/LptG family permease [Haoranjiania flava]